MIRFCDPSVTEAGPRAALVDREAFLSMLDRDGLSPVWVIAGEKGVFGGRQPGGGFGGRYVFSSVYQLQGKELKQHDFVEYEYPTREQLTALLGRQPPRSAKMRV